MASNSDHSDHKSDFDQKSDQVRDRSRSPRRTADKVSLSPCWCFTWNNYPADWKAHLDGVILKGLITGLETGESGTPHVQGWVEREKRFRPSELKLPKQIHWKSAKGTALENYKYCAKGEQSKEEWEALGIEGPNYGLNANVYTKGTGTDAKPKNRYKFPLKLSKWQQKLADILLEPPDNRTVRWIWEPLGKAGKTSFQKYWVAEHPDTLVLSGKAADMKNGIITYIEKQGKAPRVVICNIPRSVEERFVSFTGLEEIKDMLFYSGKYEGGMVNDEPPHLVIFANWEPDTSQMSGDRWHIIRIPDGKGEGIPLREDWRDEPEPGPMDDYGNRAYTMHY